MFSLSYSKNKDQPSPYSWCLCCPFLYYWYVRNILVHAAALWSLPLFFPLIWDAREGGGAGGGCGSGDTATPRTTFYLGFPARLLLWSLLTMIRSFLSAYFIYLFASFFFFSLPSTLLHYNLLSCLFHSLELKWTVIMWHGSFKGSPLRGGGATRFSLAVKMRCCRYSELWKNFI